MDADDDHMLPDLIKKEKEPSNVDEDAIVKEEGVTVVKKEKEASA
jgi:hypothetical protein